MTTINTETLKLVAESARCDRCNSTAASCRELRDRPDNDAPFGCCDRCNHATISPGTLVGLADGKPAQTRSALDRHLQRSLSIYDYLNQREWWQPNQRPPMRIMDMTAEHRYNSARWLLRRARSLADRYGWGLLATGMGPLGPSGDAACAAFESMVHEHDETSAADPQGWIRNTPLYQALTAGLPGKPNAQWRLAQRARHWGPCPARTSNSAVCICTPGTAAAFSKPGSGMPVPVLVVDPPRPPKVPSHRLVRYHPDDGWGYHVECRCEVGRDHNAAGDILTGGGR